ncbi:MAG: SPOR domain-containing protein [Alkalilacustris sp.]
MIQADHDRQAIPLLRGLVQTVAAVVSLALVAGFAVWVWTLAVRDVSGVPVVRALEGPMRVAPPDPGGMQAAHQGLSVNAVAAGAAPQIPDRITLAPAPPPLDASDMPAPGGWTAALDRAPEPEVASFRAEPGATIARSPIPKPRPDFDLVAETAARAVLAALSPGSAVEIDPDSLTPGTRLVQIGSFDDGLAARAKWDRLLTTFPALMEDKARVIQRAEAGGRDFYRLRVHGFGSEAEARRFCSVLIAEDTTCIPVLIR